MVHRTRSISRVSLYLLFAGSSFVTSVLAGDTAAGKNREGNQLFAQGRYADAEKAYIEALAKVPGRPELLYNHGNSLILQKKLDSALQQLRQAASKGGQGLRTSAWYNSGNALFEMGKFQDAAQAYIQTLRNNPTDRDAKHNLELALRKLQQQSQSGQGIPNTDERGATQPQDQSGNQQAENKPAQESSSPRQESSDKVDTQQGRQDGSLSKSQALQILEAIHNQELADQRKHLQRLRRRKSEGKDW